MSRSHRRAERIRSLPLLEVMLALGYNLNPNGGDREQQYHCQLHGSGRDSKPSARFYAESNSTFCFGCGKARDALALVEAHYGYNFQQACQWVEQQFHLEPLPFEDDAPKETFQDQMRLALSPRGDPDALSLRINRLLDTQVKDRTLTCLEFQQWWLKKDHLDWRASLDPAQTQHMPRSQYDIELQKLSTELMGALREAAKRNQAQGD